MKITVCRPNVQVALGFPAIESFEITRRQLRAWNSLQNKLGGISHNESWNESQGLPVPAARAWLKAMHSRRFGISDPGAQLTWKDLESDLE
jgi:hypothetical protein